MKKVLFVCIHNSARSQMAEAFLNAMGTTRFEAESAGLEKGMLNPLVVEVMREAGIDISQNETKTVEEFLGKGKRCDYVITVCDETSAEQCPVFPGTAFRLHWSFADPSRFRGSEAEKIEQTRHVRDEIKKRIEEFIRAAN